MTIITFGPDDLDNAVSESGVVHESVAGTDHDDASKLQMGWSIANPFKAADCRIFYPLHANATDFSGNNNDGTVGSAVSFVTGGPLGYHWAEFDGTSTNSYINFPSMGTLFDGSNDFSISFWVSVSDVTNAQRIFNPRGDFDVDVSIDGGSNLVARFFDGSQHEASFAASSNTLYFVCAVWHTTAGEFQLYIDATKQDFVATGTPNTTTDTNTIGTFIPGNTSERLTGNVFNFRLVDVPLTGSEVQTLYDVAAAPSSLITPSKTS